MLISFLAGVIAGLTGAASGDTLVALTAFAGVFVAVEIRRAPKPTQRVWWQTDIMARMWQTIEQLTGSYPADRRYIEHTTEPPVPHPGHVIDYFDVTIHPQHAYTGETIWLDRSKQHDYRA